MYTELAKTVEPNDAHSATQIRGLVTELVKELVAAERQALKRRLDGAMLIATLLITVPPLWLIYWAWGHDDWWRWPVISTTAVWIIVAGYGGGSLLFNASDEDAKDKA